MPSTDRPFNYWTKPGLMDCSTMINIVCNFYKAERSDVLGKCRRREYIEPRQMIAYIARNFLHDLKIVDGKLVRRKPSFCCIAALFRPVKDHVTARHSCNMAAQYIENEKDYRERFEKISQLLAKKGIVQVSARMPSHSSKRFQHAE
jgi:chromosomal replication initiation ATPase DnaA